MSKDFSWLDAPDPWYRVEATTALFPLLGKQGKPTHEVISQLWNQDLRLCLSGLNRVSAHKTLHRVKKPQHFKADCWQVTLPCHLLTTNDLPNAAMLDVATSPLGFWLAALSLAPLAIKTSVPKSQPTPGFSDKEGFAAHKRTPVPSPRRGGTPNLSALPLPSRGKPQHPPPPAPSRAEWMSWDTPSRGLSAAGKTEEERGGPSTEGRCPSCLHASGAWEMAWRVPLAVACVFPWAPTSRCPLALYPSAVPPPRRGVLGGSEWRSSFPPRASGARWWYQENDGAGCGFQVPSVLGPTTPNKIVTLHVPYR